MSVPNSPQAPLHVAAKYLCGDKYFTCEPSVKKVTICWTNALLRWYQLNRFMLDDDIEKHLSPEQFQSFRFLREWWTAQYQPPEASLVSRLKIEKASDGILAQSGEEEGLRRTLTLLELMEVPGHEVEVDDTPLGERAEGEYREAEWDMMTYSGMMENLFIYELFEYTPYEVQSDGSQPNMLDNVRHQSALRVYCQQISMARVRQLATQSRELDDNGHNQEALVGDSPGLALSPWENGPLVKSCRWLDNSQPTDVRPRPYYLWDCHQGQTVTTKEFDHHPEYTIVSHTWGRWKIFETGVNGVRQQSSIDIEGVPWPVPRNTRFDVSELTKNLDNLKQLTETRYIWIDLLCIPQAYSSGNDPITADDFSRDKITRIEIGRQAEIFRHAKYAVAWFNDVEDFNCLSSILNWLVLSLIKLSPGSKEALEVQTTRETALSSIQNGRTGLLDAQVTRKDSKWWTKLNSWFTSLWTLQELCLRPDMWMCSLDWSFASVVEGQPISFRAILAIWLCWQNAYEEIIVKPTEFNKIGSLMEFRGWVYTVGLEQFDALSPIVIMAFGEKRVCTRRRAEAIMSALGTTKWYKTLPSDQHEKDLVLDKYPLTFVNELKDADRGNFFCYLTKVENESLDAQSDLPPEFRGCQGKGSMLPFSPDAGWYNSPGPLFKQFPCHESVRSWTISINGSVRITRACVLAGKQESIPIPLPHQRHLMLASLTFVTPEKSSSTMIEDGGSLYTDLEAWVLSKEFEVYAVVVTYQLHNPVDGDENRRQGYNGLILGRLNGAESFVNLGQFLLGRTTKPLPETIETNWTVA